MIVKGCDGRFAELSAPKIMIRVGVIACVDINVSCMFLKIKRS